MQILGNSKQILQAIRLFHNAKHKFKCLREAWCMCRNKTGWKSRRDHSPVTPSPVVESRLTASPLEVARPAAPRLGRTLGSGTSPAKPRLGLSGGSGTVAAHGLQQAIEVDVGVAQVDMAEDTRQRRKRQGTRLGLDRGAKAVCDILKRINREEEQLGGAVLRTSQWLLQAALIQRLQYASSLLF